MTERAGSFSDLFARLITALVMAVIGLAAVWMGGGWFKIFVAVIVAVLIWELVQMLGGERKRALSLGAFAAAVILISGHLPAGLGLSLPLLFLVAFAGVAALERHRTLYMPLAMLIMLAAYGLIVHRDSFGLTWMLWLVLVVIATDILGYFAGRIFGGPKFWPAVSPKKTWSGTIAGWIGAGGVGAIFMMLTGAGVQVIGISVALSMASQMGDIAESAVKRKMGVKDSSNLLPGHGGVFDRFDGMLGAAMLLLIVESLTSFPPMPPL